MALQTEKLRVPGTFSIQISQLEHFLSLLWACLWPIIVVSIIATMDQEQLFRSSTFEFQLLPNTYRIDSVQTIEFWSVLIFLLVALQIFMLWALGWSTKSMIAGIGVGVIIFGNICFYYYQHFLRRRKCYLVIDLSTLYLFKQNKLYFRQPMSELIIEPLDKKDPVGSGIGVFSNGTTVFTIGTKAYCSLKSNEPIRSPDYCLMHEKQWPRIQRVLLPDQLTISV